MSDIEDTDTGGTEDGDTDSLTADIIQLPCLPDEAAMTEHVNALFRYSLKGRVELAWTSIRNRKGEYPPDHAEVFELDDLETLVARALELSAQANHNLYISAGLRTENAANKRHGNEDVIAVAALKADCDAPGCLTHALAVCEELRIRPSFAMFTGKHPHTRGSLWWILEEPDADTARAQALEKRLAALFGSDTAVTDPSRIMRLAGSVAWPTKRGRQLEMTGVYTPQAHTRAAPYTLDEIAHAIEAPKTMQGAQTTQSTHAQPEPLAATHDFTQARITHDIAALIRDAQTPGRWHDAVLQLTAHLWNKRIPNDVIVDFLTPVITQQGYSYVDTRADLTIMLRGAEQKWERPKTEPKTEPAGSQPSPSTPAGRPAGPGTHPTTQSPFVTIDDMLSQAPPEFLIRDYLVENTMSVLWGTSHAFKSFVALDFALSIAHGGDWHGKNIGDARPTLYICAEGQYGFGVRSLVWREHRAGERANAGFHVLPLPVNFLEPQAVDRLVAAAEAFGINPALTVVDTLARNFGQGDESKTPDMNRFVDGIDLLRRKLNTHVMVVHHTGKDESRGERGAYSLRGAVDTSIKLERDGKSDRIALIHYKQKDAPEMPDLALRVVRAEAVHPHTGEIVTSLLPILDERPRGEGPKPFLTNTQQRAVDLFNITGGSLSALSERGEINKSNLKRTLLQLIDLQILRVNSAGFYDLTNRSELNENVEILPD